MRATSRHIALALALLFAGAGHPAMADEFSDLLATALAGNPTLAAARAGLAATEEGVRAARAGYLPTVTATGQVQATGAGTMADVLGGAIVVEQPLFQGFTTRNSVEAAQLLVLAEQQALRGTEQRILLDAIVAYADAWRDAAIRDLRASAVRSNAAEVTRLREALALGQGTQTAIIQAEGQGAVAEAQVALAEANLTSSMTRLVQLVGRRPESVSLPSLDRNLLPRSTEEAMEIALREAPSLLEAAYRQAVAEEDVQIARGEMAPTIQAFGRLDVGYGADNQWNTEATVGIGITIPLYAGGAGRAEVRQESQQATQAALEIQVSQAEATAMVGSAYAQWLGATAQVAATQDLISASQRAAEGIRVAVTAGAATSLDLLSAEQALISARITATNARHDQFVAYYALLYAIGRLDMPTIVRTVG